MTREFEVRGQTYRTTSRLSALEQFHVGRRLGPLLATVGSEVVALARAPVGAEEDERKVVDRFVSVFPAVAQMLAAMSDDDVNYVVHTCLRIVQRRVGDAGYQSLVAKGGVFMFDDVDMDAMLRIVVEVLRDNLGGFLKGLGGSTPSPSS